MNHVRFQIFYNLILIQVKMADRIDAHQHAIFSEDIEKDLRAT